MPSPAWRFTCLLLALALTTGGCWDRRELDEIGIVLLTAIDRVDGEFRVAAELAKPTGLMGGGGGDGGGGGGGQTGEARHLVTGRGKTVLGAMRSVAAGEPRQLFWADSRVLILGEEVARTGMEQVLDAIDRDREFRESLWLLVARGQAAPLLQTKPRHERSVGLELSGIMENRRRSSRGPSSRFTEFMRALNGEGESAVIGVVGPAPTVITADLPPPVTTRANTRGLAVAGAAVFHRRRQVGWLDGEAAEGMVWVLGEADRSILEVTEPKSDHRYAVQLSDVRAVVTARVAGKRISFLVDIRGRGVLAEALDPGRPSGQGDLERVERLLAAAVQRKVLAAVRQSRRLRADFLRLGGALNRQYPQVWRQVAGQWPQVLAGVPVDVQVDVQIISTGVRIRTP